MDDIIRDKVDDLLAIWAESDYDMVVEKLIKEELSVVVTFVAELSTSHVFLLTRLLKELGK